MSAEQFESEISVVTRTLLELQDMQMRMADRYDDDMEHVRGQLKQLVNRATVEQPGESWVTSVSTVFGCGCNPEVMLGQ